MTITAVVEDPQLVATAHVTTTIAAALPAPVATITTLANRANVTAPPPAVFVALLLMMATHLLVLATVTIHTPRHHHGATRSPILMDMIVNPERGPHQELHTVDMMRDRAIGRFSFFSSCWLADLGELSLLI